MYTLSPTYELQILRLIRVGEREGNVTVPYTTNNTYFEIRHIPLLPWKGSRNTTKERFESHTRNL